jgi:2,3-bisphosphoglycerate-dependent phosphoglycerate mutase
LRAALKKEMELYGNVPGLEGARSMVSGSPGVALTPAKTTPADPRIVVLHKLNITRGLYENNTSSSTGKQILVTTADGNVMLSEAKSAHDAAMTAPMSSARAKPIAAEASSSSLSSSITKLKPRIKSIERPVVVITRHGKTEYNKLGIFTGWDDAPLAAEGVEEARRAGRLLRMHGIEFDVVYTSWLSRAIETAWLILEELDSVWLPIMKSWRLNERMYGALTGLSKKMIAENYGEEKFRRWRRGYNVRPPAITSFSASYPGNDERYVKYVKDIRFSVFESLIRSISARKFELHRKFPKTESLKDCMSRTIPYFTNVILPHSIDKGRNVLIASSENAIRGLLMHLCEIPPHRIHEVEIPTGLPLVYDVKRKCIHLLDDGSGDENLLAKYNFGSSPELLFRPCELLESDLMGMTDQTISASGISGAELVKEKIMRIREEIADVVIPLPDSELITNNNRV